MQSQNDHPFLTSSNTRTKSVLTVETRQPLVSLLQVTQRALLLVPRCSQGNRHRIPVGRNIEIIFRI